jgi:tagatose 6-phosphate kinase
MTEDAKFAASSAEDMPDMLTIAEVAKYLKLHELTVRRLAREGELPAFKVGRQWRIKRDQLDRGTLGQRFAYRLGQTASGGPEDRRKSSQRGSTLSPVHLATVTLNGTLDRVLLVPDFALGEIRDSGDIVTYGGGKGLNMARTARALGAEVMATGLVAGQCGEWIRALLKAEGIAERLIHLPHGQSRISTIIVDPERGQTTVVNDLGPPVPPALWPEIRSRILKSIAGYPWVALGGSVPPGLPDPLYADLCRDAQARDQRICLDTRGRWLAAVLLARPYLVKCNQHEAAGVLGRAIQTPEQARDASRVWTALGIRYVVITMGAQGAVAAGDEGAWHIRAPEVRALCPIGSGDAMMAGLIVALGRGHSWPEAVRYGVAVGAANALVPGSGHCDLEVLPELLSRTPVRPI